jgi:hypothetical protein
VDSFVGILKSRNAHRISKFLPSFSTFFAYDTCLVSWAKDEKIKFS